ncbi:phage tail tape measure protein [Corynebacterium doosanense]|uniref:Phage tail tape measure protein domain-containing protein n=1 Tax=Corynebacterium doosanense CAU 212 = DSM 45436 TaxID=558173 RepID=A0A097IJ96_9CORY|nr:phage tail tape measure protein [Corynebacterium doosanense]AIT62183.1 hypothetical protein CDOO_01980 [Corynebacterium doosanense CAU 212 = DSM 45436]
MSGSTVWVPVLASMKGFVAEVNKGANTASKSAGQTLEKGLGAAGAAGGKSAADQLASAVESQTKKVVAARTREAGAASALQVEESKLEQLRQSGSATAGQIATAEARVESARSQQVAMQQRLSAAETDLNNVRNGGEARATSLVNAENKLTDAKLATERAALQISAAEQRAEDARAGSIAATNRAEAAETALSQARQEFGDDSREAQRAERELEQARKKADAAATSAVRAEGEVTKERRAGESTTDQLRAAELRHAAALEDVERASHQVADATDEVDGSMGGMGSTLKGMGGIFAGLGLAMGVEAMMGSADAISTMNSQLGLTGPAAAMAGDQVSSVMRSGLVSGTEEATQAVGSLISQFDNLGMNGEKTAGELSRNLLGFTQTFGVEAAEATQTVGQLVKNGLASDVTEGLDLMTAAFQRVPAEMRGELPEIINEYGTNFRALGFSGEEAFGMLVTQAENGKWALDKTGDALKEFSIRGSDMSKSSVDAFTSLGLSAEDMASKIAGGGAGAREALEMTAERLLGIEDPAERANTAIALFGTPLEDLSVDQIPAFLEGLSGAESSMEGFGGSSEALAQSIEQSLGGRLTMLKGTLMDLATGAFMTAWDVAAGFLGFIKEWQGPLTVAAVPLGALALGMLAFNIQTKIAAAGGIINAMKSLSGVLKITAAAQWLLNGAMWANPLMWIVAGIAAVVGGLYLFFTKTETGRQAWEKFTGFMSRAWEATVTGFKAGYENYIKPVFDWIAMAWEGLKALFSSGDYKTALRTALGDDNPFVLFLINTREAVETGFAWIQDKFTQLGTGIGQWYQTWVKPVFDAFKLGVDLLSQAITWWIQNITMPALALLGQAFNLVWSVFISPIFEFIKMGFSIVGAVITGIINGLIIPGWNFLGMMIQSVWVNIIQPVWGFISTAAGLLADILTGNFSNIGNRFSEMGGYLRDIVHGVIAVALDYFRGVVDMVGQAWNAFRDTVSNVVGIVRDKIGEMVSNIGEIPGKIQSLFAAAGSWLVNSGRAIINGLWEGMKGAWSSVKSWLSSNLSFSAVGSMIGLRSGGIVQMAEGGITRSYVDGGIDQLEAYANGGGRENHVAQIAPAGAWRIWAEDETGGEAYIPLAPGKRERSTAILDDVAGRFGYQLVDAATGAAYSGTYAGDLGPQKVAAFADGAVVGDEDLRTFAGGSDVGFGSPARSLEGAPYVWGGTNWGDCSGAMSAFANVASGRQAFGSRFATGNEASELSARGFTRGRGGEGDLRIGFLNGGPAGGHTAGTLPDGTNVEMGGGRGNGQIGGGAAGAWDSYFDTFFYMPVAPKFENVELDGLGDLTADPTTMPMTTYSTSTKSPSMSMATSASTATVDPRLADPASPQEATAYGADVAKSVFAGGMGSKSALQIGADAVFDFFGMGDSLTKKALTTPLDQLMPVPDWYGKPASNSGVATSGSDSARTSTAETHAAELHDAAVTTMTPAQMGADPQLQGLDNPDVLEMPKGPGTDWGQEFFAYEIARAAQARSLSAAGAKIGEAVALVESGDPMQMWANNAVPGSLGYKHDAVGSDYDSVGLFQQRDNGAWGTLDQRMDPYESAGLFFDAMLRKYPDWESKEPGAVAQGVQGSAYPDRYATKMARGEQLVTDTGLYDTGGYLPHRGLALNLSGKREPVLTDPQWTHVAGLINAVEELSVAADGGDWGYGALSELIGNEALAGDLVNMAASAGDTARLFGAAADELAIASAGGDWGYGALAEILGNDDLASQAVNSAADIGGANRALDSAVTSVLGPTGLGAETPGLQLVVNLDGQQILEDRIEAVEGKAEVSEKELRGIKRERRAPGTGVTLLA